MLALLTRHRLWLLLAACLSMWVLVAPLPARAQDDGIFYERRDSDITILPDGSYRVEETWVVRFTDGPFDTLSRPFLTAHLTEMTDWAVVSGEQNYQQASSGAPGTFQVTQDEETITLSWFFEPASANETRTFTLRYTVHGALAIYDMGDQFRWRVVEWDRAYPIDVAHVVVHLPRPFEEGQVDITNSHFPEVNVECHQPTSQTVECTASPFRRGIEWVLWVTFPHGVIEATPQAWQLSEDQRLQQEAARDAERDAARQWHNQLSIGVALAVLLADLMVLAWVWYTFVRRKPTHAPPANNTTPPDELPPGLAHALLKGRADEGEVIATLIDLARRGYLRIEEHPGPEAGTYRFVLERRTSADESQLFPYERTLLQGIVGKGDSPAARRDLDTLGGRIYTSVNQMKEDMCHQVVEGGYCLRNPAQLRRTALIAGVVILVGAFFVGSFFASVGVAHNAPLIFLMPAATIPLGLGFVLLHGSLHTRTPAGEATVARLRGFLHALPHITPPSSPTERTAMFERYLPFAIAGGIVQEWVTMFANADTPAPAWYRTADGRPVGSLPAMREGLTALLEQLPPALTSIISDD